MSKRKFVITTRKTVSARQNRTLSKVTSEPGMILTGAAGEGVDDEAADKTAHNASNSCNWDGCC